MEPRIEIRGCETKELYVQLYRCVFWFLPVMTTAIYVLYGVKTWLNENDLAVKIITTVIYAIFTVVFMQIPKWFAKRAYKNRLKYCAGTMPEDVCQFGENILIQGLDGSQKIPYEKIKKIHFLKDGIAITLIDRRTMGIPNRDFTKGSMAELKAMFREKCPNIKIPQ